MRRIVWGVLLCAMAGACSSSVPGSSETPEAEKASPEKLALGVRREPNGTYSKSLCDKNPGGVRCHSRVRTDASGKVIVADGREGLGANVWGADDLERAYGIPRGNARGATVAVLAMGDYASAESDLATYRRAYGLPPCTSASGCFTKINPDGATYPLPSDGGGNDAELMLDLAMVSAGCPDCRIIVAEANADWSGGDRAIAHAVQMGAQVVTMSYSWGEPSSTSGDTWLNFPGVSIFASSGDSGYGDPNAGGYPATSAHVTAVGGTQLQATPWTSRGFSEEAWTTSSTAWGGSHSHCSGVIPKPAWQGSTGCSNRASTDVSAVSLGVAAYFGGWMTFAGTSASAPLVAGIYAETRLAGSGPSYSYYAAGNFNDVTTGIYDNSNAWYDSNGVRASCNGAAICTTSAGWDGPTGNGTPNGSKLATGYWSSVYKNSFEGSPSVAGTNASKWWFAGNAGIDVNAGYAIPGEQNDGWANAYSGWNAVNTWLYTTPGQTCDVAVWVRTSQSNFGTGYIAVNNEANTRSLGGTGAFGVLPGDPNFAGYQRMNFSFTATDTQEIFYAGFWGNGQDSWIQVDDLSMKCRPTLQPFSIQDYQTGIGLYAHGTGVANGSVQMYYRNVPGQPAGWLRGATFQATNNQFAGMDPTYEESFTTCTASQAAGYIDAIAIDGAGNESTVSSVRACELCASIVGQSSGGCH